MTLSAKHGSHESLELRLLRRENERLRAALQKVADLVDSEVGEPLDDAIVIANKALGNKNG